MLGACASAAMILTMVVQYIVSLYGSGWLEENSDFVQSEWTISFSMISI